MPFADPVPTLVINCATLWRDQQDYTGSPLG